MHFKKTTNLETKPEFTLENAIKVKKDYLYLEGKNLKIKGVPCAIKAVLIVRSDYNSRPDLPVSQYLSSYFSNMVQDAEAHFAATTLVETDTKYYSHIVLGCDNEGGLHFDDFAAVLQSNNTPFDPAKYWG